MSNETREELERWGAGQLDRLASVLAGFDTHLDSVRRLRDNEAAPGSLVAREIADEASVATDDLQRPILDAVGFATVRMVAATDHFRVLAMAIKAPPRPFAPQTLARQGVELVARAFDLLDPSIDPGERAARFVTDLLHSLWETELRGGKMEDGWEPAARVGVLLRWAGDVGLQARQDRRGRHWVGERDRLGSTRVIESMMGERIGAVGYSIYSAPAHGGIGGLADRLERSDRDGTEEDVGAQISVGLDDVALLVSWVVTACLPAFQRYFEVHGWDDDMTVRWKHHALKTAREVGEAAGIFRSR